VRITHDRIDRLEQVEPAVTALVDRNEASALDVRLGDDDRDSIGRSRGRSYRVGRATRDE
jgi:hypothetical protein